MASKELKKLKWEPCKGGFQAFVGGGGLRIEKRGTKDDPVFQVFTGKNVFGKVVWTERGKPLADGEEATIFATELYESGDLDR